MKNLLTYVSPDKEFNDEHKKSVKIQIDNSLSLGWKKEDIILATNFDYKYRGIKSTIIGDDSYCTHHWTATKIYSIVSLFESDLIEDDLYWYHDFDCFQLNKITEDELGLESSDMGLTNYGRVPRLCSASMFFKKSARDIIEELKELIDIKKVGEENGIMRLINKNMDTIGKRVKLLNNSYAFHRFNIKTVYPACVKPIRAAHFHLTPDKLDFFVHGKNKLNKVLIPDRLIRIFSKHDFK